MIRNINQEAGPKVSEARDHHEQALAESMPPASRRFLDELLLTPSPTGNEQAIQRLIQARMRDVADSIEPDVHGNLVLSVNPSKSPRVMLAGHCDQLGFLVKYINPSGYIYLDSLGGVDYGAVLAEHVIIHGRHGPVSGIIGRKPIHLQSSSEMSQIPPLNRIWVDIGARDQAEAEQCVQLGDYVTLKLGVCGLLNGRIAAAGLDNKAGLFVCLETLRRCAEENLDVGLYAVSTVQEEIGSRGAQTAAFAIDPQVTLAVDVVNATDDPAPDNPQQQVACRIGGGPALSSGPGTNVVVERMLHEAADRLKLSKQRSPSGKSGGNDSQPMQVTRGGTAAASIGIPQRNMHTQAELCALSDINDCVRLLVEFLRSIKPDTDFRPFHFGG